MDLRKGPRMQREREKDGSNSNKMMAVEGSQWRHFWMICSRGKENKWTRKTIQVDDLRKSPKMLESLNLHIKRTFPTSEQKYRMSNTKIYLE